MKALFIGGTGNISYACSLLALKKGWDLYLLNRGNQSLSDEWENAHSLVADVNYPDQVLKVLKNKYFDVVINFIAFNTHDIERDYHLFKDITKQYIFISSASCYQKPLGNVMIKESWPLKNPYWDYARDKMACEDLLVKLFREKDFPVTIIRPSLTYDKVIPVPIGGYKNYNVVDRIKKGKPLIVHGDGSAPWIVTHARDFAKGLVGLMGNWQSIGHPFHITTDEILTWDQIYMSIGRAVGVVPNLVHIASQKICELSRLTGGKEMEGTLLGDKSNGVVFDNSKIKSFVPEFSAHIRFSNGIAETIRWFEEDEKRMLVDRNVEAWIDGMLNLYNG